jgi:hypothetical protein
MKVRNYGNPRSRIVHRAVDSEWREAAVRLGHKELNKSTKSESAARPHSLNIVVKRKINDCQVVSRLPCIQTG